MASLERLKRAAAIPCIMDAYDLVVGVLAYSPAYNKQVNEEGVPRRQFQDTILAKHPHDALSKAQIRPHHSHGTSDSLESAINRLVGGTVISLWTPGDYFTWNMGNINPEDYFRLAIRPQLDEGEENLIRSFAERL